jgi:hypothetical protein
MLKYVLTAGLDRFTLVNGVTREVDSGPGPDGGTCPETPLFCPNGRFLNAALPRFQCVIGANSQIR